MTNKEIKRFLDLHPYTNFSAAGIIYELYLLPEFEENGFEYISQYITPSDEDVEKEKEIMEADNADALIHLMRQPISGLNRAKLQKKLLQYENELLPLIQSRAMTNRQDFFIENATQFFLHSQNNYSDWILQNYNVFKSEYLKSLLCLVLGVRADDVSLIPMLMSEVERFEHDYPSQTFEHAPLIAIRELAVRLMGYSD